MLKITESAWERLSQLQSVRPNVTDMRLTHVAGKIKCHRGVRKHGDRVIEHPGYPSLLMAPAVARDLSGRTLDASETKRGRRLCLKRDRREAELSASG